MHPSPALLTVTPLLYSFFPGFSVVQRYATILPNIHTNHVLSELHLSIRCSITPHFAYLIRAMSFDYFAASAYASCAPAVYAFHRTPILNSTPRT